jgi:2,3-bisphosphoglycerate-dependent phosphoglycerate mutase
MINNPQNDIFMKSVFSHQSLWATAICAVMLWSCKSTPEVVDIQGKTVKVIESSRIITADSQFVVLQEDSIDKIFYLIRHAEKDTLNPLEPGLTEAGLARATRLADILRGTRVDAIYSTLTMRTMLTVDSLADIKAMQILPYDNKGLRTMISAVDSSSLYNRIVIVGHSNTIPSITNTLAGRDVFTRTFDENEYDNFVIVVKKKSGAHDVYTLKY